MRKMAARGEMYHALSFEDMHARQGREFLVIEISEQLGDAIRALSADKRSLLQSVLLDRLEEPT